MTESLFTSGTVEELFRNSSSSGKDNIGVFAKKESALKYYFLLTVSRIQIQWTFTLQD